MMFGLWFEPEMISRNSDLFRSNPEYAMIVPNYDAIEKRDQYMLDITNEKVKKFLIEKVNSLISKYKIDYLKWDCNRYITDVFTSNLKKRQNYYHQYILSLYEIIGKITSANKGVLFESCSAGGNRFDLGMLYYMPQTWASDNTDAYDRLFIQEGTLYSYPQSTIGSHVSAVANHQTNRSISIETRFNVASLGAFGYELDLTKLSLREVETIRKQIVFYKEHRTLLQHGNYIRISSIFDSHVSSWIIINQDKDYAIATVAITNKKTNWKRPRFRFKGLEDDFLYSISVRRQDNHDDSLDFLAYGDVLNGFGLDLGELFNEHDREENGNFMSSRMFIIKKAS